MNDAIFKFKRYKDSSLSYTGIQKQITDEIGGFDTVIRREEYEKLFNSQQATMSAPTEKEPIYVNKDVKEEIAVTIDSQKPVGTTVVKEKEEPEKPDIDLSKIVEGARVKHQKFGEGVIINIDKAQKYIKIQFGTAEKIFLHSAFINGNLEIIE